MAFCSMFSDQKSFKNDPKMLPKGLQNRCWSGHGGHLGALVDKGLIQDVIFDDFGSLWGPLWGPHWGPHWRPQWRSNANTKKSNLLPVGPNLSDEAWQSRKRPTEKAWSKIFLVHLDPEKSGRASLAQKLSNQA